MFEHRMLLILIAISSSLTINLARCKINLFDEPHNAQLCDCIVTLIEPFKTELTLVNVINRELYERLHGTNEHTIITKGSNPQSSPNQGYLVENRDYRDFETTLRELTEDYFWNPRAFFLFVVSGIDNATTKRAFKDLFNLYIFNAAIVSAEPNISVHTYDFEAEYNECAFNKSRVQAVGCAGGGVYEEKYRDVKFLKSSNRSLVPLARCNMNVLHNQLTPGPLEELGVEYKIFKILSDMPFVNVTYYTSPRNTTDKLLNSFIKDHVVDIIFLYISISSNRHGIQEIIYPHLSDSVIAVIPKAQAVPRNHIVLSIIWSTPFLMSILALALIVFLANYSQLYGSENILRTMFMSFGYLTGNVTKSLMLSSANKVLVMCLVILSSCVCNIFQINLGSKLIRPMHSAQIDSFAELFGHEFIALEHVYTESLDLELYIGQSFNISVSKCRSHVECADTVLGRDGVALLDLQNIFETNLAGGVRRGGRRRRLHVVHDSVIWLSGYVHKGHPNAARLRTLESRLLAAGFMGKTLEKVYYHFDNILDYVQYPEVSREFVALSLCDFAGLLSLWLTGVVVSLCALVAELVWFRFSGQ